MTTLWNLPESANKTMLTKAAVARQAHDLGTLRKEANEAATWRGHALKWAAPWHGEHRSLQDGHCVLCGKDVQINTRPAPNGIDIVGPAVALNCLRVTTDTERDRYIATLRKFDGGRKWIDSDYDQLAD